jgi:hypothetical protein
MTTEELLRPRYKVIATWPDMGNTQNHVGQIITLIKTKKDEWARITFKVTYYEQFFKEYPHLFKPLQWWEDRKPEEVEGKYIRSKTGKCYQIKKHFPRDEGKPFMAYFKEEDNDELGHYYFILMPELITKEEYEAYMQTANQLNDGQTRL